MKKAVCFGINRYPGNANTLYGAANDALDWGTILKNDFSFEVEVVLDHQATRFNFRNKLTDLLVHAKLGDSLVMFYSGHGTNILSGKAEGYNEGLALYDTVVLDEEIKIITDRYLVSGVALTFVIDAGFTGMVTNYVVMPSTKPKFVEMNSSGFANNSFLQDSDICCIVASGSGEYAYDGYQGGRWNGVMTHWAKKVIGRDSQLTYQEFVNAINAEIPDRYPQTVQVFNPQKQLFQPTAEKISLWQRLTARYN